MRSDHPDPVLIAAVSDGAGSAVVDTTAVGASSEEHTMDVRRNAGCVRDKQMSEDKSRTDMDAGSFSRL